MTHLEYARAMLQEIHNAEPYIHDRRELTIALIEALANRLDAANIPTTDLEVQPY